MVRLSASETQREANSVRKPLAESELRKLKESAWCSRGVGCEGVKNEPSMDRVTDSR